MYERFTDRARKVMQLANQEAQRFNHEYIGTEHLLLGLVGEGSGVAANLLKNLDGGWGPTQRLFLSSVHRSSFLGRFFLLALCHLQDSVGDLQQATQSRQARPGLR